MITLERNKQKMKYSLYLGTSKGYETDDEGNIKYIEVDGEQVPIESDKVIENYLEPIDFSASINNKLNEVLLKEFGIDDSTNYAQICSKKDFLPLKVGTIIWKKSEVKYLDNENLMIDNTSADYVVMGVADEGLNFDLFLLKRNVK